MTTKSKKFELEAELRTDQGKGASRRLRRMHDKIPAILYGGKENPTPLTFDQKRVMHALENQSFYSHILTLTIDGKKHQAVLKDVQRHASRKAILHMDFQRIVATEAIHMRVPLHFIGEANCPGVKAGGLVNHRMMDVEIRCLPSHLPEFIELDLSNLALDDSLHLSDLKLPKGVELVALLSHGAGSEQDQAVVSVHLPRMVEEETIAAPTEVKTEVMPKGKEAASASGGASAASPASGSKDSKDKGKK